MSGWIGPIVLTGTHVVLEPLAPSHAHALGEAASDGQLWRLWYTSIPRPEDVERYIDTALAMRANDGAMPFVVRRRHADGSLGPVVGTTRFWRVDAVNRRMEIGHTWYALSAQRSAVNTETKHLLLAHAFETLGAIAVELRCHFLNHASRAAIARLGAKQDGILRNHQILPDGSYRDTVVFSIIASEWPAIRRHLLHKMDRHAERSC